MNTAEALLEQLQQYLQHAQLADTTELVVAYSGGLDSHVLLHLLWQLRERGDLANSLAAVHIHHGLSQNADAWLAHCQAFCRAQQIPLYYQHIHLVKTPQLSLEAQAREARYSAIADCCSDDAIIVMAQHQDDQLETLLLQLARGAGPKGLSGMSAMPLASQRLKLMRPLLGISRELLHDYAQAQQLNWVEDESNQDRQFDRNFLRHEVIPLLKQRWPQFAVAAGRSAELCGQTQQLVEAYARQDLLQCQAADGGLVIERLLALPSGVADQVVRLWLAEQGMQMPSMQWLQQLRADVFNAKTDAQPQLQLQHRRVRRNQGCLYLLEPTADLGAWQTEWSGGKPLALPDNLGHCRLVQVSDLQAGFAVPTGQSLRVCFGRLSERFKPEQQPHSKPLKQWLKLWQVPPWQRQQLPQFYIDESLVQVGDWLNMQATSQQQPRFRVHWQRQ